MSWIWIIVLAENTKSYRQIEKYWLTPDVIFKLKIPSWFHVWSCHCWTVKIVGVEPPIHCGKIRSSTAPIHHEKNLLRRLIRISFSGLLVQSLLSHRPYLPLLVRHKAVRLRQALHATLFYFDRVPRYALSGSEQIETICSTCDRGHFRLYLGLIGLL